MIFEHKVSKRFYCGASFRSVSNTYRGGNIPGSQIPHYIRIQDNQLALFGDWYLSKNIVAGVEAGHSLFRRLRVGTEHGQPRYYFNEKMNDGLLVKASVAYRLRFR
jgi:hypothetical protein